MNFELADKATKKVTDKIADQIMDDLEDTPGLDFDAIEDWAKLSIREDIELERCTSDIADTNYGIVSTAQMYKIAANNQDVRMLLDSIHGEFNHMTTALEHALMTVQQRALEDLLEEYGALGIKIASGHYRWEFPSTNEEINLVKNYMSWKELGPMLSEVN